MSELTASEIERLQSATAEDAVPFTMDEDVFRVFYERTARALWAYLSRITGDRALADDLLQETYYRFLRAHVAIESEAHGRNYLFRIATNLARDTRRRQIARPEQRLDERQAGQLPSAGNPGIAGERTDLHRALSKLKPRERALLWLAYAQGSSHRDIGDTLGVKTGSIKMLLFRARRKLAALLRTPERAEGAHREGA